MRTYISAFVAGLAVLGILLNGSVYAASSSNRFRGEIVGIEEGASTTLLSQERIRLQHKTIDLFVEAIDDDGGLIDDDERYRIVAVVEENGSHGKTVSASYKRSEDRWILSTTVGKYADEFTIYLLCKKGCNTRYLFDDFSGNYKNWYIVDTVSFKLTLDDSFATSKRKGLSSYRKWKNFSDYKDFFQGSWISLRGNSTKNYQTSDDNYLDYDQYSWKKYPKPNYSNSQYDYNHSYSYGNQGKTYSNQGGYTTTVTSTYGYQAPQKDASGRICYKSRCTPVATPSTPTTPPTSTTPKTCSWGATSVVANCNHPKKTTPKSTTPKNYYYNNPTYGNNTSTTVPNSTTPTNTYNYNNPTTSSSSSTKKVYQCSSGGCQWVYTQG